MVGHQVEPAEQAGADGGEPAGQAAGRPTAHEVAHVDPVVVHVPVGQPLQAGGEQPTWAGEAPFWGANTSAASTNRVRTSQATTSSTPASSRAAQHLDGAQPAVGGGRAADADDHGSRRRRGRRRSARRCRRWRPAAGRCRSAPPAQGQARGPGHLHDRGPSGCDRHSAATGSPEGPAHRRDPDRAAERLQRALAAVGHRGLVAVPPQPAAARATAAATSVAVAVPRNLSRSVTYVQQLETAVVNLHRATGNRREPAAHGCHCVNPDDDAPLTVEPLMARFLRQLSGGHRALDAAHPGLAERTAQCGSLRRFVDVFVDDDDVRDLDGLDTVVPTVRCVDHPAVAAVDGASWSGTTPDVDLPDRDQQRRGTRRRVWPASASGVEVMCIGAQSHPCAEERQRHARDRASTLMMRQSTWPKRGRGSMALDRQH